MYKSCISFIKFIPRYFILIEVIPKDFLISFFECLWLVIETTDFHVLSMYPTTLLNPFIFLFFIFLNPFISSTSFCVDSLEFPIYRIISFFINRDSLTFAFSIWMSLFFSFFTFWCCWGVWPTTFIRTSCSVLNSSGESRHPCLVPDLRRKSFQSSTIEYVNCGFFINAIYRIEEAPLLVFWESYQEKLLDFVKCLFYLKLDNIR